MAKIPQPVIDDIRSRTNIVEVIGQYVQLKKSGSKNYSGLCPFHNEKTPSFSVAEDKQFYHCFGCGRGGNVFNFVQEIEGISFGESVAKVAELENIPLADQYLQQASEHVENTVHHQLIELHEKASEVYHHMLVHTTAGQEALDYLLQRGLTEEVIEEFQIGFAPNQREFLERIFQNEGLQAEHFAESGLFVERENGQLADRFYQRIMFPIRNPQGKIIGFSGRWLQTKEYPGEDQPKYLNSPETKLFNKREVLFNFDKARSVIRKEGTVFLFEGFMDVIAAWQAGIPNGIASMGTSLTNQQIAAIERVAKDLVLCYDGDKAGIEATNRGIELLQANSQLPLTIVSVPEKLDPDEYFRKYGSEAFQEMMSHGRETVFSFKMHYRRANRNLGNEREQLVYIQELLQDLANVDSLIEQDRYLTQLSTEFQIGREALQQQLRQVKQAQRSERRQPAVPTYHEFEQGPPVAPPPTQPRVPRTQLEKAEMLLLYRLFNESSMHRRFKSMEITFPHEQFQELYVLLDAYIETEGEFLLAKFLDFLKNEQIKHLVITIASLKVPEESTEQEFQDLIKVLQKSTLVEEINRKKIQQQEASQKGNQQLELELAIEIINLTKQLKQAQ